jgi:hypothetical protein
MLADRKVRRNRHRLIAILLLLGLGAAEMRTSFLQSFLFTQWADRMHFDVEGGPSKSVAFPAHGPFDERLGYTRLPDYMTACRPGDLSSNGRRRARRRSHSFS